MFSSTDSDEEPIIFATIRLHLGRQPACGKSHSRNAPLKRLVPEALPVRSAMDKPSDFLIQAENNMALFCL